MSIVGNAIRWIINIRAAKPNHALPPCLLESQRFFSTEAEQPPEPTLDSSVDSFLRTPNTGLVYGKLLGFGRHTLKTDIIKLLEGCNLTPDDLRVSYNPGYLPVGMLMQFPSRSAFDNAIRQINKKGRLYRLDRADRMQWDLTTPYNGKTVVLQGIPRNALVDDVDRFLSGCEHDSSSVQLLWRPGFPDKMALARFPSQIQAMNVLITKNRSFCLDKQILVRILQ